MLEQIVDGHCQIVVRVHQPCRGNNTVAVIIRVVGECQVEFITQRQQTCHRAFGGAVHADRAVFIEMHKAERLIDMIVNDSEV